MKSELKKMMLRDDENRYWMMGGKTGSWYVYDGSAWNPADPYEHDATPLVLQTEAALDEKSPPRPAR